MKLYANPLLIALAVVIAVASVLYLGSHNSTRTYEVSEVTLDVVLDRWAEALGGVDKLASIERMYSRSQVETSGLAGSFEVWSSAEGQHRQSFNLADVYKTLTVFDYEEQTGWLLDPNDSVQELKGIEFETEITFAYLQTFSHLLPDRVRGDVEYLGFEDNAYIVKVSPHSGIPVTFYLDPETYLPTMSRQPSDERILETQFSEWKSFEGVLFATQIYQTFGDPQFDSSFVVDEVQINPSIDQTAFQRPEAPGPDFAFVDGWRSEGIPIELNNNHIYLRAHINGEGPFWFLLDSGASVTVINRSVADEVGLDLQGGIEGRGSGENSVQVALASGVDIAVQGVEIHDQTIASIPIDSFEPFEGRAMDGIIGADFFSRFVVEIDYENLILNVYDPSEYTYSGSGEVIPIFFEGSNPVFQGEFDIASQAFGGNVMIDTGASSSFGISKPFSELHNLLDLGLEMIQTPFGMGVGGESRSLLGRIDLLRLGSFELPNVIAGFSQDEAGAGADPSRAGVLGGEVLRRFNVTFNYSEQQMILEPNTHFDESFDMNMSGLVLRAEGDHFNEFVVFRVIEGSPADKAGIEVGDVIQMIDGESTDSMILADFGDLFSSEDGRVLLLKLLRGNDIEEVNLTLERQI